MNVFKKLIHYTFILSIMCGFVWAGAVTTKKKEAVGLEFNVCESPDGVHFQWSNASATQTHSIYRRLSGTDDPWDCIIMGATGKTGGAFYEEFTLDQTWDYEFREDAP